MEPLRTSVNELAQACAYSSSGAEWEEFLRRTTPLVAVVATRVSRLWVGGGSPETVDDIVQEVFLKLCEQERRILREFEPRGEDSFLGLLRIVATSVANDHFRRLHSAKRGGKVVTSALLPEAVASPEETDGEAAGIERSILYEQLDEALRTAPETISERDRSLFWLYYLHGLTAEEIAQVPAMRLSAKGVESALRRVALWLRAQVVAPGTPVVNGAPGTDRSHSTGTGERKKGWESGNEGE
jgi:RNA polymerase sigma-70 factor, ECF subfamily